MVYYIHLQINRTGYYNVGVPNALNNKVKSYEPFDQLSKRFNKYTHEVEYKRGYNYKDYILKIDDPGAWIYKYILYLNYPKIKITSVDIYFPSDDKAKKYPLIFGFNLLDNDSIYYTYWHLIKLTHRWYGTPAQIHSMPQDGSFDKDDLLTRLLEELGLYTKTNKDKFVFMSDRKPNENTSITYPRTGPNKLRITVKKFKNTPLENFDKYLHSLKSPFDVSGFYIVYDSDSLFIDLNDNKFRTLNYFTSYYYTPDDTIPIVFVLSFRFGSKLYKYSDFKKYIEEFPGKSKKITDLVNFNEDELKRILIEYDHEKKTYREKLAPKPDGVIHTSKISPSPHPATPPKTSFPDSRRPTSPPSVIPPTHIKKPQTTTINIDTSKTSGTYEYGKVQLSKKDYKDCYLFCYFIHSLKDNSTFEISSFSIGSGRNKLTIKNDSIQMVKSVIVYFNTFYIDNPILIGITTSDNVTNYYKNIVPDGRNFSSSKFVLAPKGNFTQTLIEESDQVNKTLTYQLERYVKAGDSLTYGYQQRIKLTLNAKISSSVTVFTHEPNKGQPQSSKSFVLFNQKLVDTKTSPGKVDSLKIQNKPYKNIKIYSLNKDIEFSLIIVLNEDQNKVTCLCRMDKSGNFWEKKTVDISDSKVESSLYEINYTFKKSIIIELNKNEETEYDMRLIDNTLKNINNKEYEKTAYKDGKTVGSAKQIKVNYPTTVMDNARKTSTDYKFLSHEIHESTNLSDIAGIRIFLSKSSKAQPEEIELYQNKLDATQSKNKLFLYYPAKTGLNKIYGYFHGIDSRPLLLCYDRRIYKRLNKDDNIKWIYEKEVKCFESSHVIDILKSVHLTMKKKLTFVKSGKLENLTVSKDEKVGNFKRTKYTSDTRASIINSSFSLPQATITEGMKDTKSISKFLEGFNRKTFDSVSIYYENARTNLFLFEFIDDTVKSHFQRVDDEGKYWIEKRVDYTSDTDLGTVLDTIKSTIDSTVVYEIDKTDPFYNKTVVVFEQVNSPESGFTKYTHSPKDGAAKSSFIMYRNEELKKKQGDDIVILSDIENKTYKSISVYFGTKAKDKTTPLKNIPLVIELYNSGSGSFSRIFYRHRRDSTKMYWEEARFIDRGNTHLNIINLLKQTEFDFLESIIILTDLNTRYGEKEISSAINKLNVKSHIFEAHIDADSLTVVNKEGPECLFGSGFKFREYNLNRTKADVWYGLRFFTHNSRDKRYNEITLNNPANFYKEFLYHKRDDRDDKVYVFFYGEDPRPLMVCYRKIAYRPMKLNEYFDRWYRDSSVLECCQEYSVNYKLIEALSFVVAILNEVNLSLRPSPANEQRPMRDGSETKTYNVQTFNSESIKVKVTYGNMNCYRLYTHEPIGLGSNNSGYRLGNIKYNDSRFGNLEYDLSKQLSAVSVYYSLHDVRHQFPLLIQLNFRNEDTEFFMANTKNNDHWSILNKNYHDSLLKYFRDSNSDSFEEGLYQIREDLGITFDSDSKEYLFDPDKCSEGGSNKAVVIGGSVGGVVSTAAVTGGVTVAVRPELIITSIRALI